MVSGPHWQVLSGAHLCDRFADDHQPFWHSQGISQQSSAAR
jgi:hypothetical protein